MHKLPDIGRMMRPDDFKYASVMAEGRPVHDGDYFSLRHPRMRCAKRAKIFAPFAALQGFEEEVVSKDIIYEKKRDPDQESIDAMEETLNTLRRLTATRRLAMAHRVIVSAEYYVPCTDPHNDAWQVKGLYVTLKGTVMNVDPYQRQIRIDDEVISFDDLYSLKILHRQLV